MDVQPNSNEAAPGLHHWLGRMPPANTATSGDGRCERGGHNGRSWSLGGHLLRVHLWRGTRRRCGMDFDIEGTFGDDYLYFYEESIDEQHSDDDAAEILGLLQLDPGARVLDAPCGHGRLSRRLGAAGMVVTGVDLSEQFIAL